MFLRRSVVSGGCAARLFGVVVGTQQRAGQLREVFQPERPVSHDGTESVRTTTGPRRRASARCTTFQYLRDPAETDETVQDAFVKVFINIRSYRPAWPFEVWFTRILINGCLDRPKKWLRPDRSMLR
jgi:hypothetical protein